MSSAEAQVQLSELLSHSSWLRGLARSLVRDEATADDLVQETWLAALKNPPDPDRPARPWLAGVLRKLVRMRMRGESRLDARQRASAKPDRLPSTADLVERVDTQTRLAEQVLALAEPFRTTVLLRYLHGLSSAEIARRQDVPGGTVRWRLKRGLDELRTRLDEQWGGRQAWCLALASLNPVDATAKGASLATAGGLASAAVAASLVLGGLLWSRGVVGDERAVATDPILALGVDPASSGTPGAVPVAVAPPESGARNADERGAAGGSGAYVLLTLRDADGRPVVDAHAGWSDAEGRWSQDRTDGGGRLRLEPAAGRAELFIKRESAFLTRVPTDGTVGERQVFLPPARTVCGVLLVDGVPPIEPLRLTLTLDQAVLDGVAVPEESAGLGPVRLAFAWTGDDGAFRFTGLAADWTGSVRLPDTLLAHGREGTGAFGQHFSLDRPRTDLVLRAVTAAGVAGAEPRSAAGDPRRLALRVEGPTGPLAGAYVRLLDDSQGFASKTEQTDDSGRGGVDAPDSLWGRSDVGTTIPAYLEVWAPDHTAVEVPWSELARRLDTEVVVRLEAAARIELLALAGERPLGGARVLARPRSVRTDAQVHPMQRSASLAGKLLRELEGGGALFRCNTEGRVDLTGMPAGAGVELELQDRFGNVLAQRSVAPLAAGEERSIRLEATASLSELDIELHDASGRPLVGATVELSARGEVTRVRSDAQGTVRVWHAEPGPVGIVLKKRGFVSRSIEEQRLDQLPQPARFELEHGRNVVVEFPTGGAAGTSPTRIEAITADGRVFEGTRREEGWLMANVPRSALTLRFTDAEARTTTAALAEGVESFSFEAGQH